jgi:hypothetical protein
LTQNSPPTIDGDAPHLNEVFAGPAGAKSSMGHKFLQTFFHQHTPKQKNNLRNYTRLNIAIQAAQPSPPNLKILAAAHMRRC